MKRIEKSKPSVKKRESARMMKYEREDQEQVQEQATKAPEHCLLPQSRTLETKEERAECRDEFSLNESSLLYHSIFLFVGFVSIRTFTLV